MTDTDAEPAIPNNPVPSSKWMFPAPSGPLGSAAPTADFHGATNAPVASRKWTFPAPTGPLPGATTTKVGVQQNNSALTTLQTIGFCGIVGGFIAIVVGLVRSAPRGDSITSALQFANMSTLIMLTGAVLFLIGAMALVGALTVVAGKKMHHSEHEEIGSNRHHHRGE